MTTEQIDEARVASVVKVRSTQPDMKMVYTDQSTFEFGPVDAIVRWGSWPEFVIPVRDLLEFAAEWVREQRMAQLRTADTSEILGVTLPRTLDERAPL